METKTIKTIKVETFLSEKAITHFEYLIHWFWDNLTGYEVIGELMQMLEMYVKTNPGELYRKPSDIVCTVSKVIQLLEQLNEAVIFEDVHNWNWEN